MGRLKLHVGQFSLNTSLQHETSLYRPLVFCTRVFKVCIQTLDLEELKDMMPQTSESSGL